MNTEDLLPLLDLLVKSAAIFTLAVLACLAWRGGSAAGRHMVWLAAFLALLLLPLTKLAPPRWSFAVAQPDSTPVRPASPMTGRNAPLTPTASQPAATPATRIDWRSLATAVWMAGTVLLLVRRAAGSFQLRRLVKRSRVVDSARTLRLAREIPGATGAELRESAPARVPMTWGFFHPVILLPAEAAEWSDAQLVAALTHEAGHILRNDYALRLFTQIACAICWVNPLLWLAAREMRIAQELACDDLVLGSGINPEEYASQLVRAVKGLQSHRSGVSHSLAMAQHSTLETRVRAIMDSARNRRPLARGGVVAGVAACAMLLLAVSLAQIGAAADTPASGNSGGKAPSADVGKTVDALMAKIKASLPKGWTVAYLHERSAIQIIRTEPVPEDDSNIPNAPARMEGEKPETYQRQFFVIFDIQPYTLSDAEYARYKAENVEIQKRIDAQYKALLKMHMDQKFDDFMPRTEEEKKQVDAYKSLKATLHDMPDYRYGDISLIYSDPYWMDHGFGFITDEAARRECQQVFKQVLSLFAKYPGVED